MKKMCSTADLRACPRKRCTAILARVLRPKIGNLKKEPPLEKTYAHLVDAGGGCDFCRIHRHQSCNRQTAP